jgi:serine/threonine protein kinase
MPDPNDPSLIIDPRLGSLLVSASGHLAAPRDSERGTPLAFSAPAAAEEVGTLGPYRVVKELGRGAMGAVFLAVDTRLDRQLALKVMLPEFAASAEGRKRFLREARAAARIGHDNVVTVFEADERDGIPYIAMQLLQGYPLDAFVQNKGTPSLRHAARIAREAALGLAAAHKLGVVHRDVKPANLWLEAPQGRVKLLDFGLARPEGLDTELTKSGVLIGTPAFMSPEQALGERVDHRTDLFSLGAVLYWLCTGQLPFPGPSVVAVLKALGTAEPKPVLALNPRVPGPLAELIHRLLAKAPQGRPQTAAEVANRLHEILEQSAGLIPAVLVGGADPAGAPAGGDDPWTTVARSPATQHAGPAPLPGGEPKVLRSMRVVAITPMNRTEQSQEEEQKEEAQKPAPGATRTVISSGVLWEEAENGAQQEQGETEAKRPDRPRRRVMAEDGAEETEAKRPDRPRRRGKREEDEEEEWDTEERLDRLRRRTAKGKQARAVPVVIGVGVVALVVACVAAALIVAGGKPKATESAKPKAPEAAPPKADDRTAKLPGSREEPPKAKATGPTVYLAALAPFDFFTQGPWQLGVGREGGDGGGPIMVQNTQYKYGISLHPPDLNRRPTRVSFPLGREFKRFQGWAGISDTPLPLGGTIVFTVYGDGRKLWESQGMKKSGTMTAFEIDVTDVTVLRLETHLTEGNCFYCHAVWFDPWLER